jgi:FAD/FMN-containing dehydrogenase
MTDVLQAIAAVVGDNNVLTGDDVSSRPANWGRPEPGQAKAIIRPATTAEVAAVMRICSDAGQKVVPYGGNTGLVQGAAASSDEIIVTTERMNAIEGIDIAGSTMTVQAGVPLQKAQEYSEQHDLYFPLDFPARGSATIGGVISTNAGGNAVIRYGMTREQILGLEVVLADGTILTSMNNMLKNNAGYDLKQLFIGTEGTLGIVTRAVLRLRPELKSQNTALVALDDFDKIPDLLRHAGAALGGTLNAFEVLWDNFYKMILATNHKHTAPVATGYPFYVLIESRGGDQQADTERFQHALEEAFEKELIVDASIASNSSQRNAMWAIRDDIESLIEAMYPPIIFDVSVPISDADTYVQNVLRKVKVRWPDESKVAVFGHLGDSNIHFALTIGNHEPEQVREVMKIVYAELLPFGGSVSAEHGIGLEKRAFLGISRTEIEIKLMKSLKATLDPQGILNAGKIFQ